MANLLEKMQKSGSIKHAEILAESSFFNAKDLITTDLPVLNIAFSGDIDGGLVPGLTILAGESKSFKTLLGLFCMKAYMNKYEDAVCLLYDSEFGATPEYLAANDIDTSRVIHIPIEHVEQLKFDIVKRLDAIERGDHVFIMIDSLGALASKKEVDDATDEKSVADMTRAKSIRSLLRIITPRLTTKNIPCIVVNHVYMEMGSMYPKTVIPGGTAVMYSANQVFVITKAQVKDGTDLKGFQFTITIEKSRFVREKSKLKFVVNWEKGIEKLSGLFDFALDNGYIKSPTQGWYNVLDSDEKFRRKDKEFDEDFWKMILTETNIKERIRDVYKL